MHCLSLGHLAHAQVRKLAADRGVLDMEYQPGSVVVPFLLHNILLIQLKQSCMMTRSGPQVSIVLLTKRWNRNPEFCSLWSGTGGLERLTLRRFL